MSVAHRNRRRHSQTTRAVICAIAAMLASVVHSSSRCEPRNTGSTLAPRCAPGVTAPDSVTILLFAGSPPASIVIDGHELTLDGRRSGSSHLRLHVAGTMLAAGGKRSKRIVISARSVVTLATAKRWRRVRGPVTITTADGALIVTARMALASYLTATLAAEAQSNDPAAYLTALAVVQRNFVQTHRGRHAPYADVCDNTHCQVADLGTMPRIFERAVTRSLRITLGSGSVLPCYYCGACGGGTLRPEQVWRRVEPGYTNVPCDNCRASRWYRWRRSVPATAETARLIAKARRPPFVDDDFKIAMGRIAGFAAAPSNGIESIERRGAVYILSGRGFGHRIGLCQAGARTLARRGRSAEAILRYYFPGVTVRP